MIYKSVNGLTPTYLSNIFSRNSSRDFIKLRNSETDLRVPLFKMALKLKLSTTTLRGLFEGGGFNVRNHPGDGGLFEGGGVIESLR